MSFAFFNTLFPDTDTGRDQGYVVLALYPEGEFTASGGPTQLHWFSWPSQKEHLVAFCLTNSDSDIYTSVALYKTRGDRKASNIAHQWVAYADADSLDLKKLKAEPSMVIETSPARHHVYWVTATDDVGRLTDISRNIAHTHAGDGCDPGGWDAGQLLRVPGSTNNKYRLYDGSPVEVLLKRNGGAWDIRKLEDIYPSVAAPARSATGPAGEMPPRSDWHNHPDVLKEIQTLFIESPVIKTMHEARLRPGQDRSDSMWRFLGELCRAAASRNAALCLAWEAPFNKYRLDGRPEEEMWNEVCRAYNDPDNQPVLNSLQAAERLQLDASEDNPQHKVKQITQAARLLSPDEREQVPTDTFVDLYTQWARTCTDAPETYHRSGALSVLTSVFGEFGRCPVRRDSNLTLWFMMLGPTTRARKTTSMNLWVDILAEVQNETYDYLLGSDVTGEALSVVLPKKDGRTSVLYRDEAHGLFDEQNKKHYFSGFKEKLTDLYSGRVPVTLRVSTMAVNEDEDKKKSAIKARTNFVMFLAGTTQQVTQVLTLADYQSGYLARFIVTEADPPPMTEEGMYTDQYDGSEDTYDGLRNTLLNQLSAARDFWQEQTPPGALRIVPFDTDAWARLQRAQWQLYEPTINDEMHDVLEATAKRMGDSLMKCAVLLAMADRKTKVALVHVLKAMELAEEWYVHTVNIAGRIMHSSWSARQEEILTAIRARTEGITEAEIYSRFRHRMQEKEIESDLNVLAKSRIINKIPMGGKVRYAAAPRRS